MRMKRNFVLATLFLSGMLTLLVEPAWGDATDNAPIVPFDKYVRQLHSAGPFDYIAKYGSRGVSNVADFEAMRAYLIDMTAGEHVTHSFAWTAYQVFDCVPTLEQPAARAMGLTSIPKLSFPERFKSHSWTTHDAFGNLQQCADGSVAILRTTLGDIARRGSLANYFSKTPGEAGPPSPNAQDACTVDGKSYCHMYAHATQDVVNLGMSGSIEIFDPALNRSAGQTFSLGQIWLTGGGDGHGTGALQTAEAGWTDYPSFGTPYPQEFIYWTADGYNNTGCYNLMVCCFDFDLKTNTCKRAGSAMVISVDGPGLGMGIKCFDKKAPPSFDDPGSYLFDFIVASSIYSGLLRRKAICSV